MSNVKELVELLNDLEPKLEILEQTLEYDSTDEAYMMDHLIWETMCNIKSLKEYVEV